jgi:hypothetical protein
MRNTTSKYLSRKLILAVLFAAIGLILVILNKLSGEIYMAALAANQGLYFGANIMAKTNPLINEDNRNLE